MKNILLKIKSALFPSDIKKIETKIQYEKIIIDEKETKPNTGDLVIKLKAIEIEKNVIDRHFLMQEIVSQTYTLRKEESYKNLFLTFSEKHLAEFDEIYKSLKKEFEGFTPKVTTFQYYSTLLTELEEYEKAIKVCEMAISYKLDDGTKGGYNGRIERIKKKMSVDQLKVYNIQNPKPFPDKNLLIEEIKLQQVEFNKEYSDGEIRQFIREVVREAKDTAKVDTGYLKRSIRGDLIGKDRTVEFRQADYGAKKGNSKLFEIATKKMPVDLKWRLLLEGDNGTVMFETN
jgi:hypothetical protein